MKTLRQSPLEDHFIQDPYAMYAKILADDDPVRFWEDYGKVAVFDAPTIYALLRDRRLGRAKPDQMQEPQRPHLEAFNALEAVSMLELEPPAHTRLRGLVLRAFTSRRVATLTPEIHAICDDLLSDMPSGAFDLLPAYCKTLPVRVIARLLGVPEEASDDLLNWSNAMVAMYQASRTEKIEIAANQAAADFASYTSELIETRRKSPRNDLLSELITAETDGHHLTRQEVIGTCILLLNAGHEATVHTLGNAVKTLLETETPREALAPKSIGGTVEEILRYDPPLHIFSRFTYEDITVGHHSLAAGEEIMLVLGAAGRDPRQTDRPDTFDPTRKSHSHSAFGGGIHFCVGAPLARLELQIGIQRLFEAFPNLMLARPPRYTNSYHFHGLENLMVST